MWGIFFCEAKWAASWQNQQNGMCAQRRLRSAWASAQSDKSLRRPHEESLRPQLPIERTAKPLVRLGGCPGWSESSQGAQPFCWFCHEAAQILKWLSIIRTISLIYHVKCKLTHNMLSTFLPFNLSTRLTSIFRMSFLFLYFTCLRFI